MSTIPGVFKKTCAAEEQQVLEEVDVRLGNMLTETIGMVAKVIKATR